MMKNVLPGIIFVVLLLLVVIIYLGIEQGILNNYWEKVSYTIVVIAVSICWYYFFKDSLPRIIQCVKKLFK